MQGRSGLVVIVLALYGMSESANAEVYRYKDANGNVVYTDERPIDVESEVVVLPPHGPPSTPTPVGRVRRAPENRELESDREQQRIDNLVQEQVSSLDRRCNEARVALEVLHQGMPVYSVGDGEYRAAWEGDTYEGPRNYLNEKQRQDAIDGQLRKLALNCADPLNEGEQDRAAANWIKQEKCRQAEKDLEFYLTPKSRAPDDFLKQKRELVDKYCGK